MGRKYSPNSWKVRTLAFIRQRKIVIVEKVCYIITDTVKNLVWDAIENPAAHVETETVTMERSQGRFGKSTGIFEEVLLQQLVKVLKLP